MGKPTTSSATRATISERRSSERKWDRVTTVATTSTTVEVRATYHAADAGMTVVMATTKNKDCVLVTVWCENTEINSKNKKKKMLSWDRFLTVQNGFFPKILFKW